MGHKILFQTTSAFFVSLTLLCLNLLGNPSASASVIPYTDLADAGLSNTNDTWGNTPGTAPHEAAKDAPSSGAIVDEGYSKKGSTASGVQKLALPTESDRAATTANPSTSAGKHQRSNGHSD